MNADEAIKCATIAKRALDEATCEDDLARAARFAQKAARLSPNVSDFDALARAIEDRRRQGFDQASRSRASASEGARSDARAGAAAASASKDARQRVESAAKGAANVGKAEIKRGTPEQEKLIARIKKAKGDYYEVLGVPKGSSEVEIKKAYRTVALKLHPDKCQATGAEEVFKTVNKAFACLSDPDKKAAFDRYGSEEPNGAGFGAGVRRRNAGGGAQGGFDGFGDDFDPAEIFNMFFNGGAGGMGGGFGPGFRVHTFGGRPQNAPRPGPRPRQHQPSAATAAAEDGAAVVRNVLHLLPLLIPVALYLLSPKEELYSFVRTKDLKDSLKTARMEIPFYANKEAFDVKFSDLQSRRRIENQIENERVQMYTQNCQYERSRWTMSTRPNCDKLRELQSSYPSVFRTQYSPW